MKRISWIYLVGLVGLIAVGILTIHSGAIAVAEEISHTESETIPVVPSRVLSAAERSLIVGNTQFAFNLYRILRQEESNLFFFPYSISMALAMVYAGSHGKTEEQLASALRFEFALHDLPRVFGALHSRLIGRGGDFQLRLANSLWWQEGYALRQAYLKTLRKRFGATVESLDFLAMPEKSRATINTWVSRETKKKIKGLLPEGSITSLTRLVLANAITFSATWEHQFGEISTSEDYFHLLNGRRVIVPMMEQITSFPYAETREVQAVELPYIGEQFSMIVLLPARGQFEDFASSLTADRVAAILEHLSTKMVQVYMPRFEFRSSFELADTLAELDMKDAFILGRANFRGMTLDREFFLEDVHHQTIVSVDENGTFATAGTAAEMVWPDVPTVRLNRPFIFLIRNIETNSILFIGQMKDSSEG
ncbi:MAG TPA: serpin family protein [Candidatus Acetothermia bacterium]|nr:serpin family protein [Candidatus Acetothermia bacterium]